MYSDIGVKIKGLAIFLAIVGAVACIIVGIIMISQNVYSRVSSLTWIGLGYIIGGPVLSWAASLVLYGFGELIERTQKTHRLLSDQYSGKEQTKSSFQKNRTTGKTWTCPSCGHLNDISSPYCEKCSKD